MSERLMSVPSAELPKINLGTGNPPKQGYLVREPSGSLFSTAPEQVARCGLEGNWWSIRFELYLQ